MFPLFPSYLKVENNCELLIVFSMFSFSPFNIKARSRTKSLINLLENYTVHLFRNATSLPRLKKFLKF